MALGEVLQLPVLSFQELSEVWINVDCGDEFHSEVTPDHLVLGSWETCSNDQPRGAAPSLFL